MHVFLAERRPPIEGPVSSRVRRAFCTFVAQRASKAEKHRDVEADLVRRSREAVAQSFAILAKVPDPTGRGLRPEASGLAWEHGRTVTARPSRWKTLLAEGTGDRYFFDIDDGLEKRRDGLGMLLSSRNDIPRETKAVLFDLAYAEIPLGRPRLFTATVRDARGRELYKLSVAMKPRPAG